MTTTTTPNASKLPLLITNNSRCAESFGARCRCLYAESWDYGRVLTAARDQIHAGYLLLSHPLAGSMKPNQTPYKSILLGTKSLDGLEQFTSLMLIEQALETYAKFQRQRATPQWSEQILKDFRTIDLSLIQGVMDRHQFALLYN